MTPTFTPDNISCQGQGGDGIHPPGRWAADVALTVMAVRYQALRPDQAAEAPARERTVRSRILDRYLAAFLAQEPIEQADLVLWLTHAAGALHRQEPASADAADLVALATGRHDDVADAVVRGVLALA
jgi:hypothetical protein